jgi:general secretion pathway protein C
MRRLAGAAVWLAAAAAAASLGVAAAPVAWRTPPVAGAPAPGPAVAAPPGADLGPILAFAPFGRAEAPAPAAPAEVPETALGLTLLGVTLAVPDSASRALIAAAGGRPVSHAVGAQVADGVLLQAVHPDHVTLKVGERVETLSFPPPGTSAAQAAGGPDLRNLIAGGTAAPRPAADDNTPEAVIARYRAAIHQDARGVMDRLGLELAQGGYRITERASPGVRHAGFRPGDVVTSVNGAPVGDMDADRVRFDEIAAAGRARVEVQRDGQTIVMSFPLR